eukprot:364319-Chlamydomonas_euryale.AAC.12
MGSDSSRLRFTRAVSSAPQKPQLLHHTQQSLSTCMRGRKLPAAADFAIATPLPRTPLLPHLWEVWQPLQVGGRAAAALRSRKSALAQQRSACLCTDPSGSRKRHLCSA